MAKEHIRGIFLQDNKVFIRSSFTFCTGSSKKYENACLTQLYAERGKEAVFARLGEDYWNGKVSINEGSNKLCCLLKAAIEWLPEDIHKEDFDAKTIGEFIGNAAIRIEKEPCVDLSKEADALFAMMKY